MNVTAIIVARAGSKRLPMKALLPFADGRSLVAHAARRLSQCETVNRVYIGSDSDAIMAEGAPYGAIPLPRSAYHCDEARCSANEMLRDAASRVDGDVILWAHPTNPLVRPETYDAAVRAFADPYGAHFDSLLSVYEVRRHAWMSGKPLNYDPRAPEHPPASKCQPIYFQDGAIFIQPRAQMVRNAYFFGNLPRLFVTPPDEVADIDTRADFDAAKAAWGRAHGS